VCLPGTWRAPLSLLASTDARMSLTNVDFPEPETTRHRGEHAERERHIDLTQVVLAGADDGQLPAPVGRPPDRGDLDALLARKIRPGKRIRVAQ